MNLQELITTGRFIFSDAPERLAVFQLVDGKRNTEDLARRTRRHVNSVRRDLAKMRDAGLIQLREAATKNTHQRSKFPVYEKVPLARTIHIRYFLGSSLNRKDVVKYGQRSPQQRNRRHALPIPSQQDVLDICRNGEDQTYEFKAAGTDVRKVTKEVCALLNTKLGGIIFYGVEDDGTITGTDVPRQKLDQPLQNSIKNSISPAATVTLRTVSVMGTDVILVIVPPWNRRDVYQFDEKVLLRKGTNVFAARPEELRKLHQGKPVV